MQVFCSLHPAGLARPGSGTGQAAETAKETLGAVGGREG